MKIRNKYCILSLSLLLSLSLALPYCCHADISELFSHNQEMSSDMMHGQHQDAQQCDCGHEFVKDYQKNKKLVTNQILPVIKAGDFPRRLQIPTSPYLSLRSTQLPPDLLKNSAPALHLLNSVFLN